METAERNYFRMQFRRHPFLVVAFVIGFIIVPLAFVINAPLILSTTSLRQKIVPWVVPEFKGKCSIGGASFGWFSPIKLTDVNLVDAHGKPLLTDATVQLDRTVCKLLAEGIKGTTFTISDAHIDLVADGISTNWEQAIEELLNQPASGDPPPALTIKFEAVTVSISTPERRVGNIDDWNLLARYSPGETLPLTLETSAAITAAKVGNTAGQLSAVFRFAPAMNEEEQPIGELTWETSGVQLEALGPLFKRFLPQSKIGGRITSIATIDWQRDAAKVEVKLLSRDATFHDPSVLSGETVSMQRGNLELQASGDRDGFKVEKLRFDSDFAEFELTALGQNLLQSSTLDTANPGVSFDEVIAQGKLDLPRLAAKLPTVLRLRENTRIDSGQVEFSVQLVSAENRREWSADLKASELSATANGRPLQWEQPIAVKLQLQQSVAGAGAWQGDITCASDYLVVKANGSPDAGTIALTADLTQLAEDLDPIIDLGGLEMAGRMQASVDLAKTDVNQIDVNGQGIVEGFRLSMPGGQRFEDPRMTIRVHAQAALSKNKVAAVNQAEFRFDSTGDHATIRLTSPVKTPQMLAGMPLEIRATGQLASWFKRVPMEQVIFADLPRGHFDAELRGQFATSAIQLEHARIQVEDLKLPIQAGQIEQPSLVLTGSGRWDRINNQIADVAVAVRAPAFAIWTEKLNVKFTGTETKIETKRTDKQKFPAATGTIFVRGDLATLQPWITAGQKDGGVSLHGKAEGKFALQTKEQMIALEPELAIRDFSVQSGANENALIATRGSQSRVKPTSLDPIWQEQQLTLSGRLVYDQAKDRLEINRVTTGARGLGVQDLAGSISNISQQPIAKLEGKLLYDLAQATELLKVHIDDELVMVGKGVSPIYYRGPLTNNSVSRSASNGDWWRDIQSGGGFSWDFFQCFGLRGGQGAFRAELDKGIVRGTRIDIPFGGGQLQTVPFVRFDSGPAVLLLSQDTVLSRALITEELCRDWLQYLAPVLADATRAEGQFSLQLTRSVVPLQAPRTGTLEGTFTIHEAQIRPGPVTQQIASIAAQVDAIVKRRPTANKPVLKIDPQEIAFRMVEGRVEHRNFEIEVGDVVVRTSGSVGLDHTLDMVAEIPIRQKWVDQDPILRGLAGQTLKIPIRGTVQNPKLDPKAIGQLSKQMLQGTANGFLNDAIDRGLQKGLQELFR